MENALLLVLRAVTLKEVVIPLSHPATDWVLTRYWNGRLLTAQESSELLTETKIRICTGLCVVAEVVPTVWCGQ